MLIHETHRSRSELLRKVAPPQRAALARETRIGAEYEWRCSRGHDRYRATVREVLTGTACAKCRTNAAGPAAAHEAGVPFMNPALRTRTSQTEQRLKALLGERIRLNHRVNAIHIARTFFGRNEVWPDVIVPQLRIAIEYDDPGRSRRAHLGPQRGIRPRQRRRAPRGRLAGHPHPCGRARAARAAQRRLCDSSRPPSIDEVVARDAAHQGRRRGRRDLAAA